MLPNFLNRSVWFGQSFTYQEGSLPSITHTHTRGTMNITGTFRTVCNQLSAGTGAFSVSEQAVNWNVGNNRQNQYQQATFTASKSWTGATSNNSAVSSLYKAVDYVQPTSIQLRAKTRFR